MFWNATTRRYSVSPEIFRFLHLVSTEFGPNSAVKPLLRTQARKRPASIGGGNAAARKFNNPYALKTRRCICHG